MRDVVRPGSGTGRFATDRILPSDRPGGVRTSRCRQYIDRCFESPGNRTGDVFYLPAGRVHSIGKGSFIVEIQQSSDITYRIYDFDRRDAAGNTRELHTELAREAIDFESSENSRITYAPENNQEVRLVTTPYFTTSLYTLTARTRCDWSATDSFVAIVLLQGSGSLTDNEGNRIDIRQGETWLLPASTQWIEITPHTATLRLLTSRI